MKSAPLWALNKSIETYLHDHLAGSTFAVELLEVLAKTYPEHETGILAGSVLSEVLEDKKVLEQIISRVGTRGPDLKDAVAWMAEKASRAKLTHDDPVGFGAFEALEALTLGIQGKLSLWHVMPVIEKVDSRVAGFDWNQLTTRAQSQHDRIESLRLALALNCFAPEKG